MKKNIERICRNCKLYDPGQGHCAVVILHEGQRVHLPVDPKDSCFFEQQYFDPTTKAVEDFNEIQEVQFWTEDPNGQKTSGNGTVKVRYPDGFFGVGKTIKNMFGIAGQFVWEKVKAKDEESIDKPSSD